MANTVNESAIKKLKLLFTVVDRNKGEFYLDVLSQYEVNYQGEKVEMPPKELEVLYFLASHQNQVFTREQLLEQVWGFDFFGDSRTVDSHVKRLRVKLDAYAHPRWQIKTIWGMGYKFEVEEDEK